MFESIKTKLINNKIKGYIKAFKDGLRHPKTGSLTCGNYTEDQWKVAMIGRTTGRFFLYFMPAALFLAAVKTGLVSKNIGRTNISKKSIWSHYMIDTYEEIWSIPNKLLKK